MSPPPVVHASWAMMLLSVLLLLPPIAFIFLARRGRALYIRRIPGIDAIEEALGRATELGKPVIFSTGLTGLDSLLFAILGIISHIGRRCATFGCRLVVPQCDYEVMPVVSETVREAFRSSGRLDSFNPQDIRFLSTEQFAFASGYMGIVHREQAASCFLFGSFAAESLVLAEAGQQVGAMQVAGTTSYNQIPFFLTSCDYTLIGEEVYAAGAYLSRDPVQLGSIRGQDLAKLVVLATILIGVIAATWASAVRMDPREGTKYNTYFARLLYQQPEQKVALAQFEVKNTFSPAAAPTAEDFAAGIAAGRPVEWTPQNEEESLQRLRQGLRRKSEALAAHLQRAARRTAEGAAAAREHLRAVNAAEIINAAEEILRALEEYSARANQAASDLRRQAAQDLAALENKVSAKRRQRAAEMAESEIATLAAWAEDAKEAGDCASVIAAARAALASGDAHEISGRLAAARRACYGKWWQMAAGYMDKCRAAEKTAPPTFLGDLQGEGLALLLDASSAASGRLLPLSYSWRVTPAPGEEGNTVFTGSQTALPVTKPGTYRVALKISEVPDKPKSVILSQVTNDPTEVRHETIAAGAEIKLSWRPPRDLIPDSAVFAWDMGVPSARGAGPKFAISHRYENPGDHLMTVEVKYRRRVAVAEQSRMSGRGETARIGAEAERLRRDLAGAIADLCERLAELEEKLSAAKAEAEAYGERLGRHGHLSEDAWPDRGAISALGQVFASLLAGTSDANQRFGRLLPQVQILGEAAAGDTGDSANAALRFREEPSWNRFRIHWHVVEPLQDEREAVIRVAQVDAVLPRPPWEKRPSEPQGGGK